MKKLLALLLVFASLTVILASCGGGSIEGSWEATEDGVTMTYTFEEDGKGKVSMEGVELDLTWSTSGDKISASLSMAGATEELFTDADYEIDGDELTITYEGETLTLTRKK